MKYSIEPDGCIRINATGILVAPIVLNGGKPTTYAKAKELAAACDFGGDTDWRLPTVDEACRISDRSLCDPAFDPDAFPFLIEAYEECSWVWTSTLDAATPESYAYSVYLFDGFSYISRQHHDGLVLAVREAGA